LDTVGTIFVAAIAGLFPAVLTAVLTNVVLSFIIPNALYYAIISVLVAITTAKFVSSGKLKNIKKILIYLLILSLIGGIISTGIQFLILGKPQYEIVSQTATAIFRVKDGVGFYFAVTVVNIIINILDKSVSAGLGFLGAHFIPAKIKETVWNSGWKQRPLTDEDIRLMRHARGRQSVHNKMSWMLISAAVSLVVIISWICISLYFEDCKEEYSVNAVNAANFASQVVDGDNVVQYLRWGADGEGYDETKMLLSKILKHSQGVQYLYVIRVEQSGIIYLFDIDTGDEEGFAPGTMRSYDEAFVPYKEKLMAGEEIGLITAKDNLDMVITAFSPIKDSNGKTVAYACADVFFGYFSSFAKDFIIKALLMLSGFMILALQWVLYVSNYYIVYPINSITEAARGFVESRGDQQAIDENVKNTRKLLISTDDEVQDLYEAICMMESDMAEHVRDLRHYADSTSKMQNGLIITMADMVENRDSDTGAHVQKTAAYVKIILNGLKAKGYYAEKLTEKFMADCETSAPLHDIGKIHISDTILNKPGKLTEEEFEIMKTHTVFGREIMENAISTVKGENYLKEARNMAAYHHERWDGKGYPEGLHGEVIPLSARIMAVADVFDALTSPRVYKPAFPIEKALDILTEESGKQFDPKCVEVFMDNLTDVKRILKKYTNNETMGVR
jgi:HD-GYP domain-containing protein (c-di-GMP phosphodiesterase class II)